MQTTETQNEKSAPREGTLTKKVEQQTAKIPSIGFLAMAGGALTLSMGLAATRRDKGWANFVGHWVPTLLMLGIYNKLVKLEGSDRHDQKTLH